ncbi:hypothetical protein As57867_007141, partial [Aphanomyces stellatus]
MVTTLSAFRCQTTGASALDPPVAQPYCIVNNIKKTCLADVNGCGFPNGQVTFETTSGSFDDGYTASVTNGIHLCTFSVFPSIPPSLEPFATLVYSIEKTQLGTKDTLTTSSDGTILSVASGIATGLPGMTMPVPATSGLSFVLSTAGDTTGVAGDGFVVQYDTQYVFTAIPTIHFCSSNQTLLSLDDAIIYPTYNMDSPGVVFPTQQQCDYLIRATDPSTNVWLQFLNIALTFDRIELYDMINTTPVLLANITSSSYLFTHVPVIFNGQYDYIVSTMPVSVPSTIIFYINVPSDTSTDCTVTNACINSVSKPMKVLGTDNNYAGFNIELNVATGYLSVNFNTGVTYTLIKDIRVDTWSHVAIVRRQTDVFGYVNTSRVAMTTSVTNIIAPTTTENLLYIGGQANLPDNENIYFAGQLGQIMLFDTAKTTYDIDRQAGNPCNVSDPTLFLCYTFSPPSNKADASRFQNDCAFRGVTLSTSFVFTTSAATYKTFTAATSQLLVR